MRAKKTEPELYKLEILVSEQGQAYLEVWTVGGVDKHGREIDPEPEKRAWPTEARAKAAAKKYGPKAWAARAYLLVTRKLVRWQR